MTSLTRNWFLAVAGCLILAAGIALADKPDKPGGGKGDKPAAIHGCITFDDHTDDRVKSDNGEPYCDSIDFNVTVDLLEFFRFHVELAPDGTGRTLNLDIAEVMDDHTALPANEGFWTLAISNVHLDEWRSQSLNVGVERDGRLRFGNAKDVLVILYGAFGYGSPLTVTRTGTDVWTIEGNFAEVARQGKGNANFNVLGSGLVPFKFTYVGMP